MSKQEIEVCDGKYTVLIEETGGTSALRYGKPWRDCVGDNLIYWLAVELDEAREKLKNVCQTNISTI